MVACRYQPSTPSSSSSSSFSSLMMVAGQCQPSSSSSSSSSMMVACQCRPPQLGLGCKRVSAAKGLLVSPSPNHHLHRFHHRHYHHHHHRYYHYQHHHSHTQPNQHLQSERINKIFESSRVRRGEEQGPPENRACMMSALTGVWTSSVRTFEWRLPLGN